MTINWIISRKTPELLKNSIAPKELYRKKDTEWILFKGKKKYFFTYRKVVIVYLVYILYDWPSNLSNDFALMKNWFFATIIEYDLTEIDHQNGNKFAQNFVLSVLEKVHQEILLILKITFWYLMNDQPMILMIVSVNRKKIVLASSNQKKIGLSLQ